MRLPMIIGAALLVGTGLLAGGSAEAALNQCTGNDTCMWANNDYGGAFANKAEGAGTAANVPSSINNAMDSWQNRSGTYGSCGYAGTNGSGDQQQWNASTKDNNVNAANSDEVSSWRTRYGC